MMKLKTILQSYWILLILILLKFILQYGLTNPVYELHRDEFLHLDQANHLAFGFISVPPFTSIIAKIIYLLGGNLFWIHFFPALFGALTIIFTWLIVETIGGSLLSRIIASSVILFSIVMRINTLFQPNSFDILAWTMIYYFLIKFIQFQKPKWLYYLSVIIALGFYNKYNVGFMVIGLLVGLILTKQWKLFIIPAAWKAFLLLLLLLFPNIIWQITNHFPFLEHMKALKANQLDNNSTFNFLMDQLKYFSGVFMIVMGAFIALIHFKPFKTYRVIGISFITSMIIFALLKAKGYYAIGLYPVLIAMGCVYFDRLLSIRWRNIVLPVLFGIQLLTFILTAKLIYPIMSPAEIKQNSSAFENIGMLRWEDGKNHVLPQDFADMLGWREMAAKSLIAYHMIPVDELKNTLIFCDNYGQTGALNFYNREKMPSAYSFNTDYIFWLPRIHQIKNIVLVGNKPAKEILSLFKEVKLVGKIENEFARENGTCIYLLMDANANFTSLFYTMADKRIQSFDIF